MKFLIRFFAILLTAFIVTNCATEVDTIQPLEVAGKKAQNPITTNQTATTATTTITDCMDFEEFTTGATPAIVNTAICDVTISGFLPSVPALNRAMIFDSENPTGEDPDLAVNQGKILIISEDGNASDPDDANEKGAKLTLDFSNCGPITLESMVVIDVEQTQGETKDAKIVLFDGANAVLSETPIPNIGDGQKMTFNLNQAGVERVEVTLDGSGAIDDICFSKDVPNNGGDDCTRTIGYWKTHTGTTGNNADEVSALLPIWLGTNSGTESTAVTTAAQAKSLLDQKNCGKASNGIGKLRSQLLAAKLNIASGADGSDVNATIAAADAFLADNGCGDWGSLSSPEQTQVLSWKDMFDDYNNGNIGPGHCN